MKAAIIAIVAVIVIGGGIFVTTMLTHQKSTSDSSQTTNNPATPPASGSASTDTPPAVATNGTTQSVTITANDESASPDTITVKKGDTVNITFAVSTQGTYHGGLEFKSTDPAVDSGAIAQGDSKVTTFTATKSFKFTPFWYQSNVQKGYFVTVNVE